MQSLNFKCTPVSKNYSRDKSVQQQQQQQQRILLGTAPQAGDYGARLKARFTTCTTTVCAARAVQGATGGEGECIENVFCPILSQNVTQTKFANCPKGDEQQQRNSTTKSKQQSTKTTATATTTTTAVTATIFNVFLIRCRHFVAFQADADLGESVCVCVCICLCIRLPRFDPHTNANLQINFAFQV